MKETSQIDRIPVAIRKALASARRRDTIAKKTGTIPEQMAAFKEVQRLSSIAFCYTQPGEVKQTDHQLTDLQLSVLAQLRAAECDWLAACTEEHWKRGESYYMDSRVTVSRRLRAEFNKANPKVS